jgi:hypothetical protein
MFRASLCSSSGGQLYIYSIWYRPTLYAAIHCTDQERTAVRSWSVHCMAAYRGKWDDTRYCKYTIVLLKMSTAMLDTCWGSWCNIIIEQIKLCIKMVINSSLHYLLPSLAEVKNEWTHTSTPLIHLHGVNTDNFTFYLSYINICSLCYLHNVMQYVTRLMHDWLLFRG